jgi:glycosyltransferase involved in cell wall biosynthesis
MPPPGDSEALATALWAALGDGGLRRRLVAAAEVRAQEFSMVRLAEAYVERYERLAPTT